jgi:hypothetical protein
VSPSAALALHPRNRDMSEHSSALSFFTDRTIGTKIAGGFAAVLLVFAVSSIFAWLTFG